MYTGMLDNPAFFASEQEAIESEISRLEDERSRAITIANDWKDIANDAFCSRVMPKKTLILTIEDVKEP